MPTVLITGASRGIGREFARQYGAEGWRVVATCRDPSKYGPDGEARRLDVADPASVDALRQEVGDEAIDVLVNNAGIYGPRGAGLGGIDYGAWEEVLRTNVLGPLRVAEALVDPVGRSAGKKMVFISSTMGSIGNNTSGGGYIYSSSKAALNMAVASLSVDLSGRNIICLLFHPGWVSTDMGGASAPVDAATSVAGMRAVIDGATVADSGGFFDYNGHRLPW
jgi:NAD(P)-dependent dehydrogenase (short-subunit alcohol dehydrogenase family)